MRVAWIRDKSIEMVRAIQKVIFTWRVIGGDDEEERRKNCGSQMAGLQNWMDGGEI